jgi:hypothetical protein
MRQPSWFSEVGFESMKMGVFCCLDAQNGLTFTGTARRRFSPLSAGGDVGAQLTDQSVANGHQWRQG